MNDDIPDEDCTTCGHPWSIHRGDRMPTFCIHPGCECMMWTRAKEIDWKQQAEYLAEALAFYANPDSYFAVFVLGDSPCGAFYDDYSTHGHPDYEEGDQRPGALARLTLAAFREVWENG